MPFSSLCLLSFCFLIKYSYPKPNSVMQFTQLCIILPSDFNEIEQEEVKPKKLPQLEACGEQVLAFLHGSLTLCQHRAIRRTKQKNSSSVFHDIEGVQLYDKNGRHNPRIFSYAEIYIGSRGFSEDEVLGCGGFGKVYKAVLPSDDTVVAVKCCLAGKGQQFEKTFVAELAAVAHLRHKNLVRLRGWCLHEDQLYLVYDYMPNRSLDRVLFRRHENLKEEPLGWVRRWKIVKGLAAALYYLHEQLETQIIHRDVKTSNVMLDSKYNARLGDFGLARWLEHEVEYEARKIPLSTKFDHFRLSETTRIGGTIGYLPPESFQKRSIATYKSDVFGFGIVTLEVVSGRRAIDLTYQDDQIILLDWIRRLSDEGKLVDARDTRLVPYGSNMLFEMEHLIHIGLLCTLHDPQSRPSMKWIVEALSDISAKLPPLPSFHFHPMYISLSSTSETSPRSIGGAGSGTENASTFTNSTSSNYVTAIGEKGFKLWTASHDVASTYWLQQSHQAVISDRNWPASAVASNTTTATMLPQPQFKTSGETVYVTAESEHRNNGSGINSSKSKSMYPQPSFSVVETPREISYKDIVSATDNFSDSRRVAELDFGTAYRGVLDNHYHVMVKRLGMKTCPALRHRFANEIRNLGRLRHRNLVQLRGWCTEQGEMLVVYDYYTATRILSHQLHHHKNCTKGYYSVLKWNHRYTIVKSLASALLYLHEEWDEQVIHRNITSSAVILEPDMNPRLGCFALAEFLSRNDHDHHHSITNTSKSVRGIFGYMSPEYVESGEATAAADVYSFGVVMLEVISGHMAVDFRQPKVLLVKKVHEFVISKTPLEELADIGLNGEYNHKELMRLVRLGIACTHSDPKLRPSSRQIVSILDGNDKLIMEENMESREEWRKRNACSLLQVRRIQALGIH